MKSDLDRLCEKLGIRCVPTYGGVSIPDGFAPGTHPYTVQLFFQRRRLVVPFFMGPAHEREPTAADVLACLCMDARSGELSFQEFCDEFGYDSDSRKAEKLWKQCVSMAVRVRRFLGDHFVAVQDAQH